MCPRTGMRWSEETLLNKIEDLGDELIGKLDLEIANMDANGSRFFKQVYKNPARVAPMAREEVVKNHIGD